MQIAPEPPDEQERLQDLFDLALLDTPPEERFDRLIRIARHSFKVPIAVISLIEIKRQWFKACQGLALSETSRDLSFCAYTILANRTLIVPDASKDPRFANHPYVKGPPSVRFYAGVPLQGSRGYNIGTFCIVDFKPRELGEDEQATLQDLVYLAQQEVKRTIELNNSRSQSSTKTMNLP